MNTKMKRILFVLFLFTAAIVLAVGCNGNDSDSKSSNALLTFTKTGCKSISNKEAGKRSSLYGTDTIYYESTLDHCLLIKHVNALFSCETNINVNASVAGKIIIVSEDGSDSGVNCICPYDLTMKVGTLEAGQYQVIIYRDNFQQEYTRFTINYSQSLRGIVTPNE